MGWRDLLQKPDEGFVFPWTGSRELALGARRWRLRGRQPVDVGWYRFRVAGREVVLEGPADPDPGILSDLVTGYLVGNRVVADGVGVDPDPATIVQHSETVHILDEGLDRFVRIRAGRPSSFGPLVYVGMEMPFGPEGAVLAAYLDELPNVDGIPDVSPALDAAFRMESWQRAEVRRVRAEEVQRCREEAERQVREQRRKELLDRLGDAVGRRAMALEDFGEAARAALAIGGATYLDHRPIYQGEMAVRFRLNGNRFECTCDARTLRVVDSGICLQDEYTGERGDSYLTLESLPGTIMQAVREERLVVFRHV